MSYPERVKAVKPEQLSERQKKIRVKIGPFGEEPIDPLFAVFLNYPEFTRAIGRIGTRATLTSTLGSRLSELACLRTAWLCDCEFLWARHQERALVAGVSEAEVRDVAAGGRDGVLSGAALQVVQAIDEMHFTHYLSNEKWYRLERLGDHGPVDAITIYGFYVTLSAAINSMGISVEHQVFGYGDDLRKLRSEQEPAAPFEAPREPPKRVYEAFYDELTPLQIEQTRRMGRRGKPTTSKLQKAMINYPEFLRAISPFGIRAIDATSLPDRLWQLACMRTVWLCDSEYLWSQHRKACLKLGVEDEVLDAVAAGPDSDGLSGLDRTIVRSVDDMYYHNRLSDENWEAVAEIGPEAVTDLILVYGLYVLQSCIARSFGTTLEEGTEGYSEAIRGLRENQQR